MANNVTVAGRQAGVDPVQDPHSFAEAQISVGRGVDASRVALSDVSLAHTKERGRLLVMSQRRELAAQGEVIRTNHAEALALLLDNKFQPLEDVLKHVKAIPPYCGVLVRISDVNTTNDKRYRPVGLNLSTSNDSTTYSSQRSVEVKFVAIERLPELEMILRLPAALKANLGVHVSSNGWDNVSDGVNQYQINRFNPPDQFDNMEVTTRAFALLEDAKGGLAALASSSVRSVPLQESRHYHRGEGARASPPQLPEIVFGGVAQEVVFLPENTES